MRRLKDLLEPIFQPNILIYDIETAGVNALNADLGYVINFGYIWLHDFLSGKKPTVLSICDSKTFKSNPHDDSELVEKALKILAKADGIVHHYGNRFDMPFLRTRAIIIGRQKNNPVKFTYPDIKDLDTCFLAYRTLKLSSNRLANVAKVLNCKYQKMDKKDGWPKWWMSYLKGSSEHDKIMREYCGLDVMTLAEISVIMKPYWPTAFTNRIYPKQSRKDIIENGMNCIMCGSKYLHKQGVKVFNRKVQQNYRCMDCGSQRNYKPLDL